MRNIACNWNKCTSREESRSADILLRAEGEVRPPAEDHLKAMSKTTPVSKRRRLSTPEKIKLKTDKF